jgi:hypothetical protein
MATARVSKGLGFIPPVNPKHLEKSKVLRHS